MVVEGADAEAYRIEARNWLLAGVALFLVFAGFGVWQLVMSPHDRFAAVALIVMLAYAACSGSASYFCARGSKVGVWLALVILLPLLPFGATKVYRAFRRLMDGIDCGAYR